MSSSAYRKALEAAGYLTPSGGAAPGFVTADDGSSATLKRVFADDRIGLKADAVFTAQQIPTSIFKDAGEHAPSSDDIKHWHEAAWNIGVAPLLWIVTPTEVRLYDCYASPSAGSTAITPLDCFALESGERLRALDAMCGRLATETGAFWSSAIGARIDRRNRVDRDLLSEISALEDLLTDPPASPGQRALARMPRELAQRFIGRCIFTWYLLDRGIAQPFLPDSLPPDLSAMFASRANAFALFAWLRATFNGDLFPMDNPGAERDYLTDRHLHFIRDFIEGRSLVPERRGQGRLFRFRFDAIPIDLVSSIYQQFARSAAADEAASQGLHYTPVEPADKPELADAAWLGYIEHSWPTGPMLSRLLPHYVRHLQILGETDAPPGFAETRNRLADYLMIHFLFEQLPDNVLDLFLRSSSAEIRHHAMGYMGRQMVAGAKYRLRAMAYFEQRLRSAIGADDPEPYRRELSTISLFFRLDIDRVWLLDQSRGGVVLPMITKGLQSINLVENSSGMCWVMLLLLACGPWGILISPVRQATSERRYKRNGSRRNHS